MSTFHRAHERIAVAIDAGIQLRDPETLRSFSQSISGKIVDVSLGGVRIEFESLPSSLSDALAPGVLISVLPANNVAPTLYLTVAWFKARIEEGSASQSSLGARYSPRTAEPERAAFLAHTTQPRRSAQRSGELRRWLRHGVRAAALLIIGLLLWQNHDLRQRLDAQDQRLAERAAAPVAIAAVVAEPAPPPPAAPTPFMRYQTERAPPGVKMASIELLNGDFVGSMTNEQAAARQLNVTLEYPCELPAGAGTSCRCQTPAIKLAGNSRADFACTPVPARKTKPESLTVRLDEPNP